MLGKIASFVLEEFIFIEARITGVYPTIFKVCQNKYDYASVAIIKDRNCSQPMHEYTVVLLEKVGEYKVLCIPISRTISCNCRKFETFGILCFML